MEEALLHKVLLFKMAKAEIDAVLAGQEELLSLLVELTSWMEVVDCSSWISTDT